MAKNNANQKNIYVFADWESLAKPVLMGVLTAYPSRAKEVFAFEYDVDWLKSKHACNIDPNLSLFTGPQYAHPEHLNFGIFLDSSPDRWGRVLMRRREAHEAQEEKRQARTLLESDYLLGVFDAHRQGALRFKLDLDACFLDTKQDLSSPPWAKLRELEHASLQLEKDESSKNKNYNKWLELLIAPGGSLGGARPKAGVLDDKGEAWIAKFPSTNDDLNVGAWEFLVYKLALLAKINIAEAQLKRFTGKHDTFLTKRFDRRQGRRIHFASAMTLLNKKDGEDDVSYLDIVDFLVQNGSQIETDLEELWRRIVFNICVSNTDDHLRNHGFLLTPQGWKLSPAYDINPSEIGDGLKLNISADDNSQNLELALDVIEYFRIEKPRAKKIINEVVKAVSQWKKLAKGSFSAREILRMENAFRVVVV